MSEVLRDTEKIQPVFNDFKIQTLLLSPQKLNNLIKRANDQF